MSVAVGQRSNLNSTLEILQSRFAGVIGSLSQNPYIGTLGVYLGAGIVTLNGRLISVGLPDLRCALGLGFDDASWIPTSYNMALMFMGPFSVYLGGLLGPRRVLLSSATIFILCSMLLPFSPNLQTMLCLQVVSGLASGTFYPLTLSYALRNLCDRHLFDGHCRRHQHWDITRSLVCRTLIVALDLLAKRISNSGDDDLHLPGDPEPGASTGA